MKPPLRTVQCLAAIGALLVSLAVFAKIEGIYVLEADVTSSKVQDSTLEISVDKDGRYSATLTDSLNVLQYTEDIVVDESGFKASFFLSESNGEKHLTFTGTFEDGELIGKASTSSNGEIDFIGNVDDETGTVAFDKLEMEEAIESCYEQVTGEPMDNIQRITGDIDSKLEHCVLKQVPSLEHISLWYRGSSRGLVPGVHMAEIQTTD